MLRLLFRAPSGKDYIYLGYPMHLTPTEFRILDYIAERQGGAADADELAAHCYPGKSADAANVSVRVSTINQKAHTIGGRKLLHLVKGRGYKICDDI
ncbi:MAG: helix-turn-helix domain-containing protein [Clostridia bacterium]|nr:helix-turn-helix domain-containing protein [Clostridia bacterium]